MTMTPKARLITSLLVILGSVSYGILVAISANTASAISSGYVAIFLTVFFTTELWRKP